MMFVYIFLIEYAEKLTRPFRFYFDPEFAEKELSNVDEKSEILADLSKSNNELLPNESAIHTGRK